MESRILNFPDAMRLANLFLSVNVHTIELSLDGIVVTLDKLPPIIYLKILSILAGVEASALGRLTGEQAMSLFMSGVYMNRVNDLLSFALREKG